MKDPYTFYLKFLNIFDKGIDAKYDKRKKKLILVGGRFLNERKYPGIESFSIDGKETEGKVKLEGTYACSSDEKGSIHEDVKKVSCNKITFRDVEISKKDLNGIQERMIGELRSSMDEIASDLVQFPTEKHWPELETFLINDRGAILKSEMKRAIVRHAKKTWEETSEMMRKQGKIQYIPTDDSIKDPDKSMKAVDYAIKDLFVMQRKGRKEFVSWSLWHSIKEFAKLVDPEYLSSFTSKKNVGLDFYHRIYKKKWGIYFNDEGESMGKRYSMNSPPASLAFVDEEDYKAEKVFLLSSLRGIGSIKFNGADLDCPPAIAERIILKNLPYRYLFIDTEKENQTLFSREVAALRYIRRNRKEGM